MTIEEKAASPAPRASDYYVAFNINEHVRVKLTDHGRKVHREDHAKLWASVNHPNPPDYIPPTEDSNGWSKWQMWSLMEAFGQHIGMARENVFDLTIEIEVGT